jgi:ATP-dependent DNA ligase
MSSAYPAEGSRSLTARSGFTKSNTTAFACWCSVTASASGSSRAAGMTGRNAIPGLCRRNRHKQFVIDGEAVILGVDGYSDFNALLSGKHNDEVQLCAFDVLAMDGDDLRHLPLSLRKTNLQRLLARRPDGIFLSDFEQGEIGPDLFVAACRMGLEGLVSKHRDKPYRGGRQKHWLKVKNRNHPAMLRVIESVASIGRSR